MITGILYSVALVIIAILFITFALFKFQWVLFIFGLNWNKSKSPFSKTLIHRPANNDLAAPIESQAVRDKLLRRGFLIKRVPDQLDAIIIGSGIGGLGVGALMSKIGKRVLVVEQHDRAGGCLHVYEDKGYIFDVGLHYVGNKTEVEMEKIIIDQLTNCQVKWNRLNDNFDRVVVDADENNNKVDFHIRSGKNSFKHDLCKKFPDEIKAIEKYFLLQSIYIRSYNIGIITKFMPLSLVRLLSKLGLLEKIFPYFKYCSKSVQEVVESLTSNKELQSILYYNYGDYGTCPRDASMMIHSLIQHYFSSGAYYPIGGPSKIVYHIIEEIQKAGGDVLCRVVCTNILTDSNNSKVIGVRLKKGAEEYDVYAPIVVSNAGIINTYQHLLSKEIQNKFDLCSSMSTLKGGLSCLTAFVGLKGNSEELGINSTNIWKFISQNVQEDFDRYMSSTMEGALDLPLPLMFISFPSTKDPTWDQHFKGKSICEIIAPIPYEWFQDWKVDYNRGIKDDHYRTFKQTLGERMWKQTLELFPKMEGHVEYFEIGTPLTNSFYLNGPKGEIYGLDHDLSRFANGAFAELRPKTCLPGLFITGQDIVVCGFGGALLGSLLCASEAMNRNLFLDLRELMEEAKSIKDKNV